MFSAHRLELIVLKSSSSRCHLRLLKCAETETKSESEENGAVGDRDGKKREQHEKVVNNFMQIKGEQ